MNRKAIYLSACVGLLAVVGVGCGDNKGEKATSSADGSTITIQLIAFKPTAVVAPVGGSVTWRQEDVATHTVTSGRVEQAGGTATAKPDGTFDSGNISKGQTFDFTFTEPGEFPFFCAIHPATMTGAITVK
jgi:plastocyanin